jgi:putative membrane protein
MKSMLIPALLVASGIALATSGCSKKDDDTTTTTAAASDTTAPADTATPAAAAPAADSHAAQFLTDAIRGDNAEIKAGQAAQSMGSSQGVKDFGKMLVDDHTKARDQASEVAKAMNVPVPSDTPPEADQELKMTMGMTGAAFDKDFVTMEVKDHKKDIAKFQAEASSSDPSQVTDLAKQTLPTLKKHLQTAQSLQK